MSECATVPKSARTLSLSSARCAPALYNGARITSEPHGCFKVFRRSCSGGPPPCCLLRRCYRGWCAVSRAEEGAGSRACGTGAESAAGFGAAQPRANSRCTLIAAEGDYAAACGTITPATSLQPSVTSTMLSIPMLSSGIDLKTSSAAQRRIRAHRGWRQCAGDGRAEAGQWLRSTHGADAGRRRQRRYLSRDPNIRAAAEAELKTTQSDLPLVDQ